MAPLVREGRVAHVWEGASLCAALAFVIFTPPQYRENIKIAQMLEVSIGSRNGAPSRKGCVVNGDMTKASNKLLLTPLVPNRSGFCSSLCATGCTRTAWTFLVRCFVPMWLEKALIDILVCTVSIDL